MKTERDVLLLQPENCCLHIIDPQQSLMLHIHEAGRVVDNISRLLECAKILSFPILANTQYKKGLGLYVPVLEEKMDGIQRPDKIEFNALANPATRALVCSLPETVTTLILVGVETHICIYQTAMGALEQGLTPWVVADAVSSRTKANHELGLARLAAAGAIVGPAEMIIYELLGRAGTSEFKAMLPHVI
jgi:nicotinamidase-related amidase